MEDVIGVGIIGSLEKKGSGVWYRESTMEKRGEFANLSWPVPELVAWPVSPVSPRYLLHVKLGFGGLGLKRSCCRPWDWIKITNLKLAFLALLLSHVMVSSSP